jgi:hypothetical protein
MQFFNQIFQKLFPNPSSNILLKEVLERSEKDKKAYQVWKDTEAHKPLLEAIAKAYFYKKTNIVSDIQVHLLKITGAKGLAISYHPTFGEKNFQHFFDFLKDKVLSFNYFLQTSEKRISEKEDFMETKEKYYLKPNASFKFNTSFKSAEKTNQLYGNILLEYIKIDDKPSYIKLLVTFYQDAMYSQVMDFDEFVGMIFE